MYNTERQALVEYISKYIINMLNGDINKNLKDNLTEWINRIGMLNDRVMGNYLKSLSVLFEEAVTDEQTSERLYWFFYEKLLLDIKNINELQKFTNRISEFISDIEAYTKVKEAFRGFLCESTSGCDLPLYIITKHIKSIANAYF